MSITRSRDAGRADALLTARSPRILGILNTTPDSFSDGGAYEAHDAAVAHGILLASGSSPADLVDIGGESTRPGARRVDPAEELARVLPVVRGLVIEDVPVSVDTMNASTAAAVLDAGALVINDVSGGLADPAILDVVAEHDAPYILSHWRGHSDEMVDRATYDDVVSEVIDEVLGRIDAVLAAGVRPERLVIDPGLGFAKDSAHNWALLSRLDDLTGLGYPVLIGASRKRFLRRDENDALPAATRDLATAVVSALCAERGVWGLRVHDVAATATALQVVDAWAGGGRTDGGAR